MIHAAETPKLLNSPLLPSTRTLPARLAHVDRRFVWDWRGDSLAEVCPNHWITVIGAAAKE